MKTLIRWVVCLICPIALLLAAIYGDIFLRTNMPSSQKNICEIIAQEALLDSVRSDVIPVVNGDYAYQIYKEYAFINGEEYDVSLHDASNGDIFAYDNISVGEKVCLSKLYADVLKLSRKPLTKDQIVEYNTAIYASLHQETALMTKILIIIALMWFGGGIVHLIDPK